MQLRKVWGSPNAPGLECDFKPAITTVPTVSTLSASTWWLFWTLVALTVKWAQPTHGISMSWAGVCVEKGDLGRACTLCVKGWTAAGPLDFRTRVGSNLVELDVHAHGACHNFR